MRVPFGLSSYDNNDYGLPPVKLENWYPEAKPQFGQIRLLPTPGLSSFVSASTDVMGLFQTDGVISGEIVYRDGTNFKRVDSGGNVNTIGTAATDSYRAQFATSQTPELVSASGGSTYTIASGSATSFTWTGPSGNIISVAELAQRHVYVEGGTGRAWFSDVADAASIGANHFFTAESEPDQLYGVVSWGRTLWLLGSQVAERWVFTGSNARPFASDPGAVVRKGCIGRDGFTKANFGVFMVTVDGQLMELNSGQNLATVEITRAIKSLSDANQALIVLSAHTWLGHDKVKLTLPGAGSFVRDMTTGAWYRQRDIGGTGHIVDDAVEAFGKVYASGSAGIFELDEDVFLENGEQVSRIATAIVPVEDGRPQLRDLTIYTSADGVPVSGEGSDPQISLRIARDTRTFSNSIQKPLPGIGEYAKAVRFGGLGYARPPAAVIEVQTAAPIGVTLESAYVNQVRA